MAEPKAKPKQYSQAEVNTLLKDQIQKGKKNLTNFSNKVRRAHEEQKRKEALFSPMVVDADPGAGIYASSDPATGLQIIPPRFAFHHLKAIVEKSDITQALIDVMKKNIEGFGYGLRFLGDDLKASDPVNAKSRERLANFFDYANESESWATISGHRRHDMEHFGFGAVEFMRTEGGEIAAAYYVPVELLRATTYESTPTPVTYSMKRDGKVVTVPFKKYFRRWVQLKPDGTIQRYFKELGDPREIDSLTGKYTPGLPIAEQATEIMVQTIFYGNYVYGMPRWLGACMDILGRRNAQQVNWDLFESQGIPRMVVMVSGGTLTEASYQSLEDLLVEAQGIANYNKVTLLEANSDSLGLDDKTNTARIDFKNLSEARQDDQMFTRYLEQTRNDIRGIYRIPPLFLGGVTEYTLASARAAVVVAEGQVFIPERILSDEPINRKIIQQQFGCYDWGFYSKGARITAPEDIANVVKAFGKTGAFTVNHVIAQANEAFGLSMSQFKEPWANYPYDLVIELLRKGELKGLEKITKEVQDNAAQVDNFQKKNDLGNVDELVKAKSKSLPNTKVMRSMLKPNELALFTTMERLNTLMAIASEMPEDGGN